MKNTGEREEQLLIRKLEQFIRRFYTNRIIRGSLLLTCAIAVGFLLMVILESWFYFGTDTRTILFYGFLMMAMALFVYWVVHPLMGLLKIGKRMSYEQAARIIGDHFSEIEDKLLNALQLLKKKETTRMNETLLIASIDQKIDRLKVFRFDRIIRYRKNVGYLTYAIPPLVIIGGLLVLTPRLISESTTRLIDHSTAFQEPFPFSIRIENEPLTAFQQDDLPIELLVEGRVLPLELWVESEGIRYTMKRDQINHFSYLFKALQRDTKFTVVTDNFESQEYTIRVFPKPIILQFTVQLDYPDYTGKGTEILENTGDLIVPEGTDIEWIFYTRDVDSLSFFVDGTACQVLKEKANVYTIQKRVHQTLSYGFAAINQYAAKPDTMHFRIMTVADAYPVILTEEFSDSTDDNNLYITGNIRDDYGFSDLFFHYTIQPDTLSVHDRTGVKNIQIDLTRKESLIFDVISMDEMNLLPGERMLYFYEIWDNDQVNGPKQARSAYREIKRLTEDEIREYAKKTADEIREELERSLREANELEEKIEAINRKLIDKPNLTWEEKKQMTELLERTQQIMENLRSIQEKTKESIRQQNDLSGSNQQILEKQQQLSELMDKVLSEEMQKQIEELKKMLQKLDPEKLQEMVQKMKLSSQDLEEQLDRSLELARQLEFSRQLEETIASLRKLAEEQQKIADKDEAEKQQGITDKYDSLSTELKRLAEQEKSLEIPVGLEKTEELQESLKRELESISEEIKEKRGAKNGDKQRKAAQKMNQLADELERMQMEAEEEQYAEDAQQIRQILENVLTISFEQEGILESTRLIQRNDPRFQQLITKQKEINDKLKSAKDTLEAIGKRQFIIQPVITREIRNINKNVDESIENLTSKNVALAVNKQQLAMTAINNIALLLQEALNQMEQHMQQQMTGKSSKSCQNPTAGKGKKSMKNLRNMQQQLSEELDQLKKGMEQQNEHGKQPGKQGEKGMNERMARMAAQQEAIRQEMQKMEQYLKEQGLGNTGEREAIIEMENLERDLINKAITQETIMRQQRILTRMLESEKAEQKREQEEKRESSEGKFRKSGNPGKDFEYNTMMEGEKDVLRFEALPVNAYYKQTANRYRIKILQ